MTDPQPLSLEELAAIEERAGRATPGPWRTEDVDGDFPGGWVVSVPYEDDFRVLVTLNSHWPPKADNEFIAHARTDIPRMASTIRALHGQVEESKRTKRQLFDIAARQAKKRTRAERRIVELEAALRYVESYVATASEQPSHPQTGWQGLLRKVRAALSVQAKRGEGRD